MATPADYLTPLTSPPTAGDDAIYRLVDVTDLDLIRGEAEAFHQRSAVVAATEKTLGLLRSELLGTTDRLAALLVSTGLRQVRHGDVVYRAERSPSLSRHPSTGALEVGSHTIVVMSLDAIRQEALRVAKEDALVGSDRDR